MSAEVVEFPNQGSMEDTPPDTILEDAKGKLTEVIVIGRDANDHLWMSSSTSYLPDALWLLVRGQNLINELADGDDD